MKFLLYVVNNNIKNVLEDILRNKRLERYKKYRHRHIVKLFVYCFFLPSIVVIMSYFIIAIIILPQYYG